MLKSCLYGPVFSWRLGTSLGVDLISDIKKTCNFNCVYCQIGETDNLIQETERKIFVPTEKIIDEIKALKRDLKIDVITIAGRGEPTLALNLKEIIDEIKKIRKEKLAIITNSMNLYLDDVKKSLGNIDIVMAKFDGWDDDILNSINRPINKTGNFEKLYKGLLDFSKNYDGFLELQIMFLEANKQKVIYEKAFEFLENIKPDRIHINTPLRPCGVLPLKKEEIDLIKNDFLKFFEGKMSRKNKQIEIASVYDVEKKKVEALDEKNTVLRRGE
jgi:wyosine [tRNA(Phe)-imidazoG37] synthetase (radical SAM superfamily)